MIAKLNSTKDVLRVLNRISPTPTSRDALIYVGTVNRNDTDIVKRHIVVSDFVMYQIEMRYNVAKCVAWLDKHSRGEDAGLTPLITVRISDWMGSEADTYLINLDNNTERMIYIILR